MGIIKEGKGTTIGNAGEYLVVGELLKREVIAAPAPRNNPGFDILATNGSRSLNIRVKTKTEAAKSWVWMASKKDLKTIFRNLGDKSDTTVLVDLKDEQSPPEYYIMPTIELNEEIEAIHNRWLNSPPKRGKPRSSANRMRRIGDTPNQKEWLSNYQSAWSQIISELEATGE